MSFVPVDPDFVRNIRTRSGKNAVQNKVLEFMESNLEAVEVVWDPGAYASYASAYSSYKRAIEKLNVACKAVTKGGKLYLLKLPF